VIDARSIGARHGRVDQFYAAEPIRHPRPWAFYAGSPATVRSAARASSAICRCVSLLPRYGEGQGCRGQHQVLGQRGRGRQRRRVWL